MFPNNSIVCFVSDASCANRCSQKDVDDSFPCQCNKQCRDYGDCCENYGLACLGKINTNFAQGHISHRKVILQGSCNINIIVLLLL